LGSHAGKDLRGVADTGNGSIEITFMYQGKRERPRMPWPPTSANLKRASTLRATVLTAIDKREFTWALFFPDSKQALKEKPVALGALTLGVAFEKALALSVKFVTPETLATYKRDARAWCSKEALGEATDVETITKNRILEALNKLEIGNKRISNFLIPLRSAMEYAADERKFANPMDSLKVRKIRTPKIPGQKASRSNKRPVPFLVSEIALLETAPHGSYWKLWSAIGTRPEEIIAARWDNVREDGLHITEAKVSGRLKEPKTAAGERVILLSPRALEALETLRPITGHQEYILLNPNTAKPFHGDRPIRHLFQRDCMFVGIRYKKPNLLRHTYASWNLEAGESLTFLAGQMGHTTIEEILRTYARHIPENSDPPGRRLQAALLAGRNLGGGIVKTSNLFAS
jgi:integrase